MRQPMYQQIAEDLRAQIESGILQPGAQLPTELDLSERYASSRNTIRDAVKWLISQGLAETRPGQGTFVTRRIDPFVTVLTADPGSGGGGDEGAWYLSEVNRSHRRASRTLPRIEIQVPPAEISRRLRVPPPRRLSVGMKRATSMTFHGRCRRPSTSWNSSPREPPVC